MEKLWGILLAHYGLANCAFSKMYSEELPWHEHLRI